MVKKLNNDKPDWGNMPKDILSHFGFVYKITNLKNGYYYIGKKFLWNQHTSYHTQKPTKVETDRLNRYKEKNQTEKYKTYKQELKKKYNGKRKKTRSLKESDWKTYWGSCDKLLKDIDELGINNFKREIIRLCENKWECAYYEMVEQVNCDVLQDSRAYNGIINVRLGKKLT